MYDHIGLKVKDLDAACASTGRAGGARATCCARATTTGAGFGPRRRRRCGSPSPRARQDPAVHVAFRAADHAAVDRFHADGLKAGGRDHGKPGLRTDYSPTYYAAFLLDPDGNNVEAVCTR